LIVRQKRSMNTLSRQQPLPSMLMDAPLFRTASMKSAPVNWLPWSVFTISGAP